MPRRKATPQDLMSLVEQVRAGVPEEWSEEELHQRIAQAISEVRAQRSASGRPGTVPLESLSEEQRAKLEAFGRRVAETRARFAGMTPAAIAAELKRCVKDARIRQHVDGH